MPTSDSWSTYIRRVGGSFSDLGLISQSAVVTLTLVGLLGLYLSLVRITAKSDVHDPRAKPKSRTFHGNFEIFDFELTKDGGDGSNGAATGRGFEEARVAGDGDGVDS